MTVDIVTIFPAMVEQPLAAGIIGRAVASGLLDVRVRDLRDFTTDRHRVVDDVPYGGGPGMSAAARSRNPSARGSSRSSDSSRPRMSIGIEYAADDEKHTAAEPGVTSGSKASRRSTVPTRSTSMIRRASDIVGDSPAACARERNDPSSRTRSARVVTSPGSLTSQTTPTVPSMSGSRTSTATR
jgi:hypothetical protein